MQARILDMTSKPALTAFETNYSANKNRSHQINDQRPVSWRIIEESTRKCISSKILQSMFFFVSFKTQVLQDKILKIPFANGLRSASSKTKMILTVVSILG